MDIVFLVTVIKEQFEIEEIECMIRDRLQRTIQFKNGHRMLVLGCENDELWIQFFHTSKIPKCYHLSKQQAIMGLVQTP